ncbi:MAG: 4-hydroxy-tetrahydrodipicolinate synthase [Phycisphaeraceae bacterium]|nr:4-hydroxy-tetrahydrodipicolinate synthase [Phycisphaeraceae bacterium]
MPTPRIHGAITALVTPLAEGQVDWDRLKANVAEQIEQGIDALVPCGTTGESPTLSHHEHERVVAEVIEAAAGRVPIIAGTGSNSTEEAIALTRHARSAGAAASLQVVPYYNKPSQEGLYRHFMTIAERCDLPIILYNIPGRTGVELSAETIQRLAEHPMIIGVKEATGSLDMASDIAQRCDPEAFIILSGDDSLTIPIMAIGGCGVISVAANLIPRRVSAMVHTALEGDFDLARRQHLDLYTLFRGLFAEGNPTTVKAAMKLCGMDTGEVRLPLAPMSEAGTQQLKALLDRHEIGSSSVAGAV